MKEKIFFIVVLIVFISCKPPVVRKSVTLNINDYFDHTLPLIKKGNSITPGTSEIVPGSDLYNQIVEWGNAATALWLPTSVSTQPDISISQGNFTMLVLFEKGGILVRIIDKDGKTNQYARLFPQKELEFLK